MAHCRGITLQAVRFLINSLLELRLARHHKNTKVTSNFENLRCRTTGLRERKDHRENSSYFSALPARPTQAGRFRAKSCDVTIIAANI